MEELACSNLSFISVMRFVYLKIEYMDINRLFPGGVECIIPIPYNKSVSRQNDNAVPLSNLARRVFA